MSDHASFARNRQDLIRQMLKTEGRVFCTQLSQALDVSEHTIRRDLQDLAREGVCRRVHGGAVSVLPAAPDFQARLDEGRAVKEAHAAVPGPAPTSSRLAGAKSGRISVSALRLATTAA